MSNLNFVLTLAIAIAILAPIVAISYLRPILVTVLSSMCPEPLPAAAGAHFWVRSAYLLAVAGTLVLALVFGEFEGDPLQAVHRALLLAGAGCFLSVAIIAKRVWEPVRQRLTRQEG